MIPAVAFILGALWGGWTAKKRGGNRLDVLQYAAVHGIILLLLALLGSIIIGRQLGF